MRSIGLYVIIANTKKKARKMFILKVGSESKQARQKDGWGMKMDFNKKSERAEDMALTTCIKIELVHIIKTS